MNIEFKNLNHPKELWEIFKSECEEHVHSLNAILNSSSDIDESIRKKITSRLHKLKGSLGFLGFKELSIEVKEVEDYAIDINTKLDAKILSSKLENLLNTLNNFNSELSKLLS